MPRLEAGHARVWLYQVGDWLRGLSVFSCLRELERMEQLQPDALRDIQNEMALKLVRHAWENVPFYQALWPADPIASIRHHGVSALSSLPIATKRAMMSSGEAVLDATANRRKLVEGRSSGSTGQRFVYYKDKRHQSWWMAVNMLSWQWAGWRPGDRWIRLQFRGKRSLLQQLEDWAFGCLNMAIDQFDDTFMRQFTERALKFQPVMLRGYSGGTYVYAKWLQRAHETRLRPRAVVLTGDTLYPHYREAIALAFGAPVFDTYGGEGMTIAIQCAEGTYHIPPVIHVDLMPEGPRMPDGQPHRIIVTSLTNTGMPFIRYDIGDLAIPADGPCACGRAWPGLKRILGRDTDIVRTPAGRHLVVHHFNNILRLFDGVEEFQVRHKLPGKIELHLVVNEHYEQSRDEAKIQSEIGRIAGDGTTTAVIYTDELPIPESGKRRYIISRIDNRRGQAE